MGDDPDMPPVASRGDPGQVGVGGPRRGLAGGRHAVLFVRRKPRMFGATYGPIRHDPGTVAIERDYLELEGSAVRFEGWRAARVVIPCVMLAGPIGALIAYFLIEYALARPGRLVIPLMQVRRVILDPLKGTVMVGAASHPGGAVAWHSFATAYVWAIFDSLEPLLPPGACGLVTRRDRALARGDLAMFLATCALTPVVGVLCGLAGLGTALSAASMGERRYGLAAALLCLVLLAGQAVLIFWWLTL